MEKWAGKARSGVTVSARHPWKAEVNEEWGSLRKTHRKEGLGSTYHVPCTEALLRVTPAINVKSCTHTGGNRVPPVAS